MRRLKVGPDASANSLASDRMEQTHRRFPFAAVGVILIAASVAPTVVGMVRGFSQLNRGESATSIDRGVALAFHPAFVACGVVGLLLVIAGIVRALRCNL